MQPDNDPDRTLPSPPPVGRHSSQTSGKSWQPPSPEELQELLPQYSITALLGRGGMGAVYRGTQINLDRPVAIKILPPSLDEDDEGANYAERFKNEARAMAKLAHPGIVSVYDSGETADGLLYIVMEFIEGTDVQKMVSEQGRLHSAHALAVTAHVCDALQYAHDRGIIHRDIKPANIMVGYDGVVKVADFGLAKMSKAGESGLTRSGVAMGTLHYMAPEALMLGSSVDHRADVYAVGVMLYFMLTGKLPQGMFELPSLQVPGLDPRYDRIIAKALRDDRDIRYQSAAELRFDLDGIITQPVLKIEPGAVSGTTPTALPTDARPQRAGMLPRPSPQPLIRVERRSSPWLWAAVIVFGGFTAWSVWFRPSKPESSSGPVMSVNPDASTPPPSTTKPASPQAQFPSAVVLPSPTPRMAVPAGLGSASNSIPALVSAPKKLEEATPPTIGIWQNLLEENPGEFFEFATGNSTSLVSEPGQAGEKPHYRATSDVLALFRPVLKDVIIRARFGPGWQRVPSYLVTRFQGFGRYISGQAFENQRILRKVYLQNGNQTTYTDFIKQRDEFPLSPDRHYELELKVVGSHYTLSIDGEVCAEGDESTYLEGKIGIRMEKGAVLEKLECMPLPSASAATPVPNAPPSGPSSSPAPALPGFQNISVSGFTKDKPFVNSIGMRFVPVPGTKILMCAHSTRKRDFAEFAATDASLNTFWQYRHPQSMRETEVNLCPVSNVSWEEAKAFCEWLGRKEGRVYRMPTDREWSFAVGIASLESETETPRSLNEGVKGVFAWGKQWPPPNKAGNFADSAAANNPNQQIIPSYTDGYPYLSPVMTFQPNELGIYDLAGNVFEWCEDWADEQKQTRVMRGGAFNLFLPNILLASHRNQNLPDRRSPNYGFRCVLELSSVPAQSSSAASPAAPAAARTSGSAFTGSSQEWVDNQGRRIVATFVRTDVDNVILRMPNAQEVPVPLSRLSEESRKLASQLGSTSTSATSPVGTKGPFVNGLGMKFVPVQGAKVWFCIHETRRGDYAKYSMANPGLNESWTQQSVEGVPVGNKDDQPVVGVSWDEAQSFCAWLGAQDGRKYRLPTDREWSIAAGIGPEEEALADLKPVDLHQKVKNIYPWGRDFPPADNQGNFADREAGRKLPGRRFLSNYSDGHATTAPVMSFRPDKNGLFDIDGNASEWCEDWSDDQHKFHTFRGGNFTTFDPGFLLSSCRLQNSPGYRAPVIGFRVVLEQP